MGWNLYHLTHQTLSHNIQKNHNTLDVWKENFVHRNVAKDAKKAKLIQKFCMGTVRQSISFILKDRELTAKEISQAVGIREKEAYEHLTHIARSTIPGGKFIVRPSECLNCGYVFKKRDRLTPPGKCFLCRSEAITPPRFTIRMAPAKGMSKEKQGTGDE